MRTYSTWQIAGSPDKSYLIVSFGLWSDAEFSIGIIIGCFPVMPKFFQHFSPKVRRYFSFRSKSAGNISYETRGGSHTSRSKILAKVKNPFAKYKVGSSIAESCDDTYAQHHGEYYTLKDSEALQRQVSAAYALTQSPGVGVATRRDDLEYGHQPFQAMGATK